KSAFKPIELIPPPFQLEENAAWLRLTPIASCFLQFEVVSGRTICPYAAGTTNSDERSSIVILMVAVFCCEGFYKCIVSKLRRYNREIFTVPLCADAPGC